MPINLKRQKFQIENYDIKFQIEKWHQNFLKKKWKQEYKLHQ